MSGWWPEIALGERGQAATGLEILDELPILFEPLLGEAEMATSLATASRNPAHLTQRLIPAPIDEDVSLSLKSQANGKISLV